MPPPAIGKWIGVVTGFALMAAHGQLTNPLPDPVASGLNVEIVPWLTIPASSASAPKARINHLKPCPGDPRLFCNDLRGKLWVIANESATSATQFLDMAAQFPNFINTPGLGTGFASFAFHPEFRQAGAPGFGKFYTGHSESESGTVDFQGPVSPDLSQIGVITEWTMGNPLNNSITTSPANFTKRVILRVGFPYDFHDVQELAFDPTAAPGSENYGCLFICIGDGGSVLIDLPQNTGRLDSPLGTILRISPILAIGQSAANFTLSTNGAYQIPSGATNANPWAAAGGATIREIYVYGFRNPHRVSWDTGGTGKMFCGNIGESMIEEIELIQKGRYYGWPSREGSYLFKPTDKTHVYPLPVPDTVPPNSPPAPGSYTYPVSQYDHATRFAVVGGYVYRGSSIPELQGYYVHGDIVTGELFVADESDMVLGATTTGKTPAPPRLLGLKYNGALTSFKSVLGASRADLRFGTDHFNELYLLSKQNGTIYRVIPDDNSGGGEDQGGPEDWASVRDFEDGTTSGFVTSVPGSSVQVVDDPIEGPVNRVLRVQVPGTAADYSAYIPVPEIHDGSKGTLFFRFLVVNQDHIVHFGLTDISSPAAENAFEVQMRSNAVSGQISVSNATNYQNAAGISTGTWYSMWAQIDNATGAGVDRWNMYIQGGAYGAPTLVKTDISFRQGTSTSLKRFYWLVRKIAASNAGAEIYFDDLHVDTGHSNITTPVSPDWHPVDRFEGASPLSAWDIPDAGAQSATIVTEADGNHYLRRAASSSAAANSSAIAAKRLPFLNQVSQTATIFFRFRLEGGNLNHSFGVSALNPADPASYTEDDFEPQFRVSSSGAPGSIDLYDGPAGADAFVAPRVNDAPVPPLANNTWYKVWMVARNQGIASGGQRWRVFLKGGIYPQAVEISEPLYFRHQAEAPITHFLTIAKNGGAFGNNALCIDDIYAFEGQNLEDPLAVAWVPTSLQRAGNQITLSYPTAFNRSFQMFESPDLSVWTPLGDAAEGTGAIRQLQQTVVPPRRFFLAGEHSRRAFHPAVWSTDFSAPALPAGLTVLSSSTWQFSPGVFKLATPAAQVAGMVGRPGGYALVPGDWKNSTITVDARTLTPPSNTFRDICILFGYIDETHFYYAHVSSRSDGTLHTVIMKVNGSTRSTIHSPATPPAVLTSNWHLIRVTHAATGAIAVNVDNSPTPLMTANDTAYPVGRAGFGSFDDPAEFRSVVVSGEQP